MSIRNYSYITSTDELATYVDRMMGTVFGFDIETGYTGMDREKASVHPETAMVVGISFTNSLDWARYVPLAHDEGENLDNRQVARLLWPLLMTGLGVAHNAVFELRHLSRWFMKYLADDPDYGEQVRASNGYFPIRSDTMVEAYLMAEFERFGLKYLVDAMFEHKMTELHELFIDLAVNKRKYLRFNTLSLTPQVVEYACEDSLWCLAIHLRYYDELKDRLLYGVDMAVIREVTPYMEQEGIAYDWPAMARTADTLRIFRDKFNAEIMTELTELVGEPIAINLGSPKQVSETLFGKLGYRTSVYTDKTRDLSPEDRKMSTGDIALTKLAKEKPVVRKILQWRNITKLLGTYLDKYEKVYDYADDGRAHPNHLTALVITGRFAHSDPNYAQSPKKYHFDLIEAKHAHEAGEEPPPGTCFRFNFRDMIVAPPGWYIIGFDLSQAELRAIAGEAQETALLRAFDQGQDVHKLTASLMLGVPLEDVTKDQRDIGKTMNFALLYGMGVKSLADRLALPIEEAQSLMDKYFAGYPGIATWSAKQVEHGKNYGYVTSKFGRKLPIWSFRSDKHWIYQKGERDCVNYPIQGAATGDYVRIAMVRAVRALKAAGLSDKVKLVMNIHDALEFYAHGSVDPAEVIKVLQPAVIFPVTGWPAMKADWHLAKRWGSPTEINVAPDGTIIEGEQATPDFGVGIDRDAGYDDTPLTTYGAVEDLPEISADVVRAALGRTSGRRVHIALTQMPTADGFDAFVALIKDKPGDNILVLHTPEGHHEWPFTSSLGPDDLGRISGLLGPVEITYDTADVDPRSISADLTW